MAQVDSENTTALPAVPTRRRFLSQAAGVAAGSAVLIGASTVAAPAIASHGGPDPIFAAIEAHKAARAVVYSACDDISAAEREIGPGKISEARKSGNAAQLERCEDALSAAHDAEVEAACVLVTICPTTLAGVLALLEYANAADTDGEGWPSHLYEDDETSTHSRSWHSFLIDRLAEALPGIVGAV
jgi:hypothetical protein